MSIITTIQESDAVSDSREVINENFDNLNTHKLETSNNLSDLTSVVVARSNLNLGNVDNTSDADKPISTAQQTALDLKLDASSIKRIVKTVDETITASTTLQADNELVLPVSVNQIWTLDLQLLVQSPTAADFKCNFTVPSGTTYFFGADDFLSTAGSSAINLTLQTSGVSSMDIGVLNVIVFVGATPGNITFQWAQNASNGGNTTVYAGSNIIAHKLA
jgi:hypothetical protein